MYAKQGRFGPYVQLGEMSDDSKPKTASLFRTMSLETMTLDIAQQLLTLPRTLGVVDGEEVKAHNGKFGPYVTHGKESRNMGIENEAKLLTLTLEEALEILKQPKQFRGRGAPKPPLKVLGPDPVSGKEMVLKEGRFGLYVTDGETNASLRKGDTVESLTPERAAELMEARREYIASGASPRGKKPKGGGKKKAAAAVKGKKTKASATASEEVPAPKAAAPKSKGKAKPAGKKAAAAPAPTAAAKKGKGKTAAKKKGRS